MKLMHGLIGTNTEGGDCLRKLGPQRTPEDVAFETTVVHNAGPVVVRPAGKAAAHAMQGDGAADPGCQRL